MELDALRERQREQQLSREKQYAEDRERYIRERQEAQRILAEQEAKRIQKELEKAQDKKKGPPPPTMGK
jgi:nucleotidyltransferase/DNA polymerase involved in DNA repair